MQKSMMLIINPNAGKGGYKNHIAQIMELFCNNDWKTTVYFTRFSGHGSRLVRDFAEDYDMVVCLGGDGTLSEITSGMMTLENKRPIGYIPLGTANDVARTLGLSNKPVEAAKQILTGSPTPYDIGQFGPGNYFTYIAAFGAFTEVSYATPQEKKHALGHMAYMLEGIKSLPKLKHHKAIVEWDDGVVRGDFIFGAVTNSTSVAGLVKLDAESVNLSDGMFEVLLVKNPVDILDLSGIISSVLSNDFSGPNVMFLKSREVRMMFDSPVSWTRDGEDGGIHQDVFIVNRHPGVEIIV